MKLPSPGRSKTYEGESHRLPVNKAKNMDQSKLKKVPGNTITRDVKDLAAPTGNIYESVVIMYKRANQIAAAEKKELDKKLEDFRNDRDTMEEVFENKEQIEISKYYERQPKPDLIAIKEFEEGELTYRFAGEDEKKPQGQPKE